ncbi:MAG: NAD(P)H-dependent oxidoreductase, partial [bacterium]
MNVLVLLAHPTPGSFNHAIAETVVRALERLGHSGFFHDLYAEGFD